MKWDKHQAKRHTGCDVLKIKKKGNIKGVHSKHATMFSDWVLDSTTNPFVI